MKFSSGNNKASRHVETLFVLVLNQNKPPCLVMKKEVNNN